MAPPLLSEPPASARRSVDLTTSTSPSNPPLSNNHNPSSNNDKRAKTSISTFFESILLFLLDALRKLFTSFGRKGQATSHESGYLQPTSPSITGTRKSDLEFNTMARTGASTMPPRSHSGTPPQGSSTTSSTTGPGRKSVSKLAPSLPRIHSNKANVPRSTVPTAMSASSGNEGMRDITNGLARMSVNGKSGAAPGRSNENRAGTNGNFKHQRLKSAEKIVAPSIKPLAPAQPSTKDVQLTSAKMEPTSRLKDEEVAMRPEQQQQQQTIVEAGVSIGLQDATNGKIIEPKARIVTDQENTHVTTTANDDIQSQADLTSATEVQYANEDVQIKARVPILNVGIHYSPEERAIHAQFINDALDMARLALKTNETPVGCVLVQNGRVIARGMNATNRTRNGTRHAELMALSALLSFSPASDQEAPSVSEQSGAKRTELGDKIDGCCAQELDESQWGDVDPTDGHLFPYGQKLHPSPRVDKTIVQECTLYVTVEPCVMCASLLRQLRIKKVFFGAVNDKFGGTGGVFRIHQNAPSQRDAMASAPPSPTKQQGVGIVRPVSAPRASSVANFNTDGSNSSDEKSDSGNAALAPKLTLEGDGGQVEPGYLVEGGWGRDEAVTLLRQFYVQENGRAPVPRKKEGRAARLAAMMERDGHAGGPMIAVTEVPKSDSDSQADGEEKSDKSDNPMDPGANFAPDATENVGPEQPEMVAGSA